MEISENSYFNRVPALHRKVFAGESLVGWFATGNEITSHSAPIHEYYARETKVRLERVDLSIARHLKNDSLNQVKFEL